MTTTQPVPETPEDFGDYARDEDEEADVEDLAEPSYKYLSQSTSNVYYPIALGEVLNERYLIEHKVGAGGGSTVWMAHDLQTNQDVAVKVLTSNGWAENELRMQDIIRESVFDKAHLVTYVDRFILPGEKGNLQHHILVLPLMGPCLDWYTIKKLPMTSRMSAARQLLETLDNLHRAGIVHRDVNERNCMWGLRPFHSLNRTAKYQVLGRPIKMLIPEHNVWKKGELVTPMTKRITDPETPRGYPPKEFCSPERLHGFDPSPSCDMWSYMVVFSVLWMGFRPFAPFPQGGAVGGIVQCLGPLPEEWKGSYTQSNGDDSSYDQSQEPNPKFTLEAQIARLSPDSDPVEKRHVLDIMSKVFQYRPEKRPTASELLRDASFRAIMDTYNC
ncbi:hypothetical protein BDV06DRAFT_231529 [Aspergillus oleicola]